MNKRWIVLTLFLMGQGAVQAAECPAGTTLQVIGQVRGQAGTSAATELVSSAGALVRASRVACGGTACRATAYDADSNSDETTTGTGYVDANVKEEPGAPANESRWETYDPPLSFTNGISVHDDGNVNGVLFYRCG